MATQIAPTDLEQLPGDELETLVEILNERAKAKR